MSLQRQHFLLSYLKTLSVSLTKAHFALETLWRLGTIRLPSMLTIIPSRSQTNIVFISNNSRLIYTFFLFYLVLFNKFLLFFIVPFLILHSIFIRWRQKLIFIFKLFSQRTFYCNVNKSQLRTKSTSTKSK